MEFHDKLKWYMHQYVKFVYRVTKKFPREEQYGVTSQIRRATVSVILNYIEGYARRRGPQCKVYRNFLETSYGSLRESRYLLFLSLAESYITKAKYNEGFTLNDKIGQMLWPVIKNE